MLPFLKARKSPGVIAATYEGDKVETDYSKEGLVIAAEDILSAIAMKDAERLADAIKSAFEICDASPHLEGPHEDIGEEGED